MSSSLSASGAQGRADYAYIHALRLLACYLVIINHTHGELLDSESPSVILFCFVFFSLCKIGVTLFVMISGTLLLGKDYGIKKTAWYITRSLVLVLGVTVLLVLWQEGPAGLLPQRFFPALIAKPRLVYYWYLYALPGFYLLVPFLQKMVRSFTPRDYLFFTVFLLLLPRALSALRILTNLPVADSFSLAMLPPFATIAVAGRGISLLPKRRKYLWLALGLFLLGWGFAFGTYYIPWRQTGEVVLLLSSWMALPTVVMSGACLYLFRYFGLGERLQGRAAAMLRETAGLSLGIYVIHPVLNHRVHELGFILSLYALNPIAGVLVHTLGLFFVSAAVAFVLRRIPFVKKFL